MFGSGPVKGFAVVHCLGILTSMFSAVFFSRGIVNLVYGTKKKLEKFPSAQSGGPFGGHHLMLGQTDVVAADSKVKRRGKTGTVAGIFSASRARPAIHEIRVVLQRNFADHLPHRRRRFSPRACTTVLISPAAPWPSCVTPNRRTWRRRAAIEGLKPVRPWCRTSARRRMC